MHTRARLLLTLGAGVCLPAACVTHDSTGPVIPDNAIVYVMSARSLEALQYHFVDTTAGQSLVLDWLTAPPKTFAGANCIGLMPRSATDTVGTFVFVSTGPNIGSLERHLGTTIDTVLGYFLPGQPLTQGTHGGYVVDSAGRLKFTWADGTPTQYFDPSADIRLSNDTILSHAELTARADSMHASWHVSWVRDICQ
jgi:hypothetical protein